VLFDWFVGYITLCRRLLDLVLRFEPPCRSSSVSRACVLWVVSTWRRSSRREPGSVGVRSIRASPWHRASPPLARSAASVGACKHHEEASTFRFPWSRGASILVGIISGEAACITRQSTPTPKGVSALRAHLVLGAGYFHVRHHLASAGDPTAVCISCGHFKALALVKCPSCGFTPSSEDEQARSLILAPVFDAGEEVVGLAPQQLTAAAAAIQAGRPYEFDLAEVAHVARMHAQAREIGPRRLAGDLIRWLAGPVLLVGIVLWLIWRH
jgi:hypothetical protein